ncbi:TPA: hypothetical protein KEY68_001303 [Providencia rettgeri]|uniref:hypothetical protein n=1 Tax=Morganellaceae TaxID=1903414 RepID=UPI001BA09608|nr:MULTISPECIES: hypothetical protein [Morganellaceae]MDK7735189.1 hypothetical protein [Providencia stuartii]UFH67313.1 hypothetical protein KQH80_13245 [Morganella morganii]HBC7429052.1 hypothetical protein [Providencia rettgeri]
MSKSLPILLSSPSTTNFPATVNTEIQFLSQARNLLDSGFPDHALLDIWNAAIHNLRRRIEVYGLDLFLSAIKDDSGRKKYDKDGETINERWSGVDDLVLISGSTKLGVLNKKAGKSLEMINWMRNHASPAHASDSKVEAEDVFALALMLQKNLFESDMPDPGHSPSGLFEPIKKSELSIESLDLLKDQIKAFKQGDIRITFGFLLDLITKGENPAYVNASNLFEQVWEKANDDLKKSAGERYHSFMLAPESDTSEDKGAKIRILETLVKVDGVKFIPDAARASLYRHAIKQLTKAKDTSYGWNDEERAAKALIQFGPHVPSIAFEDVYQEILTVWVGNYWGRSNAHLILQPFLDVLNSNQLMALSRLFVENERANSELVSSRPKRKAIELLEIIKGKLTIQASIDEIDRIISEIDKI